MTAPDDTPTGSGRKHTLISIGDEVLALRADVAAMKVALELALKPVARPTYVNLAIVAIPLAILAAALFR